MTPAIGYFRFSPRPGQDDCDSIEKQQERIRAYCLAHEYTLVGEYEDRALSGGSVVGREGFQAAVEHACREKATLIFFDQFRFARNTVEAIQVAERLRKAGANLASLREHIDTNTASGRMFFGFMAVIAQWQRESAAERTKQAMRHYQANGRRMGRADRIPYGTRLGQAPCPACGKPPAAGKRHSTSKGKLCSHECHVKLLVHANEQVTIQAILARHKAGQGPGTIATALNKAGSSCRGKPWQGSTIMRIIKREMGRAA